MQHTGCILSVASAYKELSSLLYLLSFYLFFFIKNFSLQEKQLLRKKQEETEEAELAKRSKVVVTFDLVGRKVSNF
jgi:preprotein translocase subunit YajC